MVATVSPLSPEQRRQLLAEDARWVGQPFDPTANPRAIHANTRHMALLLRDRAREQRATAMATFATDLLGGLMQQQLERDRAAGDPTSAKIACGKGCSYCCTTFVSATIPEVLRLAHRLRGDGATTRRVTEAAARARNIPQAGRAVERVFCPVLTENACAAYTDRPLACRSLLSNSLEACVRIFERQSNEPMTYVGKTAVASTYLTIMIKAALQLAGLSTRHVELTQSLTIALAMPDAEARWLAGEPLFDGVQQDSAEQNTHLGGLVNALAKAIQPTL